MHDAAGSAAAPAVRYKNCLRWGSFTPVPPPRSDGTGTNSLVPFPKSRKRQCHLLAHRVGLDARHGRYRRVTGPRQQPPMRRGAKSHDGGFADWSAWRAVGSWGHSERVVRPSSSTAGRHLAICVRVICIKFPTPIFHTTSVRLVHNICSTSCPLYPQKRTWIIQARRKRDGEDRALLSAACEPRQSSNQCLITEFQTYPPTHSGSPLRLSASIFRCHRSDAAQ